MRLLLGYLAVGLLSMPMGLLYAAWRLRGGGWWLIFPLAVVNLLLLYPVWRRITRGGWL